MRPERLTCLCIPDFSILGEFGVGLLANDVIEKLLEKLRLFMWLCKKKRFMIG